MAQTIGGEIMQNVSYTDLVLRYRKKYDKTHVESMKEIDRVIGILVEAVEGITEKDSENIGELGRVTLPNFGKIRVTRHAGRPLNGLVEGETGNGFSPSYVNIGIKKSSKLNVK